ncbi:MAG: fdrA domain protein [bacterium]|nr:fdrA domain protein [bacterium]
MDTKKINSLFQTKLQVLNIGLVMFHRSIKDSGGESINMDWNPPAGGDRNLMEILRKLKGEK